MPNYTIDPEDLIKQRIVDRLAIEQGLPQQGADLEQRMPVTTAMPNATAEAQGIATPEQINYTMNQLEQRFNPPAPTPPSASEIGQSIAANPEQAMIQMGLHPTVAKELAKHIADTGPAKLIGKDIFGENRGGIFGTGISPIDVLAFGLGAAITSRLPQDQAIATTMKIAGMPSEFKAAQRKAGGEVIAQLLSAGNLAATQGNLQARQTEQAAKTEQLNALKQWTDILAKRAATGVPFSTAERLQMMALGTRAGVHADVMKATLEKAPSEILAEAQTVQRMLTPEGGAQPEMTVTVGGTKFKVGGTPKEKALNPTELKVFADTGVRGATIPAGMDQATAKMAVDAEQTRQISLTGGKAKATSENTPLPPQVQDKIASIDDFKRTIDRLITNAKDSYSGPVRGRTYELARQGIPGFAKVTDAEAAWRSDLANAISILVNVRSGQQSAEPEFKRLAGIVGTANDDPKVLMSSLKNMQKQLVDIQNERKKLATQPKMEVYRGGVPSGAKKVED